MYITAPVEEVPTYNIHEDRRLLINYPNAVKAQIENKDKNGKTLKISIITSG